MSVSLAYSYFRINSPFSAGKHNGLVIVIQVADIEK
jgi:hypothetical protein